MTYTIGAREMIGGPIVLQRDFALVPSRDAKGAPPPNPGHAVLTYRLSQADLAVFRRWRADVESTMGGALRERGGVYVTVAGIRVAICLRGPAIAAPATILVRRGATEPWRVYDASRRSANAPPCAPAPR